MYQDCPAKGDNFGDSVTLEAHPLEIRLPT